MQLCSTSVVLNKRLSRPAGEMVPIDPADQGGWCASSCCHRSSDPTAPSSPLLLPLLMHYSGSIPLFLLRLVPRPAFALTLPSILVLGPVLNTKLECCHN